MTAVTTLYDTLVTRVGELLPSHQRLGNPYELEENPNPFLKQGYGIAFSVANNPEREISCRGWVQRDLIIVLTRKFYARDTDRASKASAEKDLLEDLQLIIDDAEKNFDAPNSVALFKYTTDNGIEPVRADEDHYISVSAVISAEYSNNL